MDTVLSKMQPKQPEFLITTQGFHKVIYHSKFISHFYCFDTGSSRQIISAIPDGCVDILFCCDDNPYAVVAGTVLNVTPVPHRDNAHYFGVRLMPGVHPKSLKYSASDVIGRVIPYEDVFEDTELIEKIASCLNFSSRIEVFLKAWRVCMPSVNVGATVQNQLSDYLVREIMMSGGGIHIRELADKSCYSIRYLTEVFTATQGISPKKFERLIRFQLFLYKFTAASQNDPLQLVDLATECGYYDQPHLTRDFRQLTGTTPLKYMKNLLHNNYNQMLKDSEIFKVQ
ncbi:MAG: AraC family transcriptional regulator [Lachnospiraceae bacterium]